MQAASRESLALARQRLADVLAQVSVKQLRTLSDELFAVLAVLTTQRVLRRHVSDPSTTGAAKRRLVDTLFGGKVGDTTLETLIGLADSRWSQSIDLLDALEILAREATLTQAERAGVIEDVEDELFRFSRILDAQAQLDELLSDEATPADRRIALLDGLIADKVQSVTRQLLEAAVRLPTSRSLESVVEKLAEFAAARRDRSVAHVKAAAPLNGQQEQRLTNALTSMIGRAVSIQVEVDPSVLGGLVIRVGDDIIDGSVAARLALARQQLPG